MRWMAALVGGFLASCFDVTNDAQGLRCASSVECPAELVCYAGYCVQSADAGLEGDAGRAIPSIPTDAGTSLEAGGPQEPASRADASSAPPASPSPRPQAPPAQTPPAAQGPEHAPPEQREPEPTEQQPESSREDGQGDEDQEQDDEDDDEGERQGRKCSKGCGSNEICQAGICCPWDRVACDGRCVDPWRDRKHCGVCGNRCDYECRDGRCIPALGRVCLDDVCFDW